MITIYIRFILSMWCQYLSILLPVNHGPFHVAFRIAGVEREGLATNVALATSLCIEGDYWEFGNVSMSLNPCCWCWYWINININNMDTILCCWCLCIHVVDVGSTVLSYIHLTVFGISGGEVVKVVPIVEPNLKETWFCHQHMADGYLKYILYWQDNISS